MTEEQANPEDTKGVEVLLKYLEIDKQNYSEERHKNLWLSRLPVDKRKITFDEVISSLGTQNAQAIAKWLETKGTQNLLLQGSIGVGKTTAAIAFCDRLYELHRIVPMFTKYQSLFKMRLGKTDEDVLTWRRLLQADVLIVDDIIAADRPELSEWKYETLYELFDERYTHEKATIITTNLPPDGLKSLLGERIIDRFRSNSTNIKMIGESKR